MKIDWSDVDWSLTNAEIAAKKQCSPGTVKEARNYLAPETTRNYTEHDWSDVDWRKSDKEIARLKQAKPTTVWEARRRLAPQTIALGLDWNALDWSLSNAALSLLTGKSTSQISAKRKALGMPPAPRSSRGLNDLKKFEIFLPVATEKVLRAEAAKRGASFSQTVLELLESALSSTKN